MKKILFLLLLAVLFASCSKEPGIVMTVKGPLNPDEMGITLTHEHIIVDFIGADSTGPHRWNRDTVVAVVEPYLQQVRDLGCQTFIDCTPEYLGRDVEVLRKLSGLTGLNIITCTGYYGAYQNKYIPPHAFTDNAQELAEHWIAEWEQGIGETGIRPGIIKIGVDGQEPLTEMHRKLVEAAAITHLASGLVIASHTGPETTIFEQQEILAKTGVAPDALIWTHAQRGTMESHIRAAREGIWVSLDNIRDDDETIGQYVQMLRNLKDNGLLNHVLLSHDAGWYDVGNILGTVFRPYTSLFTGLVPALKEHGFTQEEIDLLMVENPKEAYTIRIREL
jgi:phosphotriesterase-related protein